MNLLILLATGKIPSRGQIIEELFDTCMSTHATCSNKCPVYKLNNGIPRDSSSECQCFKDGLKMLNFIREWMGMKPEPEHHRCEVLR